MKKTIIITAIIFAVSAVLTVCFAVALGANGLNKLIFDENAIQRIENIGEIIDDIGDRIDDRFDNSFDIDGPSRLVTDEHIETTLSKDTAVIGCDAAEITIVPSADGKLSTDFSVYSYSKSNSGDYRVETGRSGYDIYISKTVKNSRNVAKVIVYVPDTVKNLKIDAQAAEITIKDLTFDSIDISVNAGEVDIENTETNNCNVKVNAGEANLERNFTAKESVTVKVNAGEICYELPVSTNAVINYSVNVGSVDVEDGLHGYKAFDKDGNSVTFPKKSGRLESSGGTGDALEVNLSVNTGNIEFEQIFE